MTFNRFDPKPEVGVPLQLQIPGFEANRMAGNSGEAAAFLKAMSHEGRLLILTHLAQGERSVTELEHLLQSRQAAVSQQLARLRLEGLVSTRREGKTIFYAIQNAKVLRLVEVMGELFGTP